MPLRYAHRIIFIKKTILFLTHSKINCPNVNQGENHKIRVYIVEYICKIFSFSLRSAKINMLRTNILLI